MATYRYIGNTRRRHTTKTLYYYCLHLRWTYSKPERIYVWNRLGHPFTWLPWEQLAPLLRSFDVNTRKKNGKLYKLSALKSIRFGLRWEDTKWRYVKSYRHWRYSIAWMHVYFLFRFNETTPFMSPRVGMTFSGHLGLRL